MEPLDKHGRPLQVGNTIMYNPYFLQGFIIVGEIIEFDGNIPIIECDGQRIGVSQEYVIKLED